MVRSLEPLALLIKKAQYRQNQMMDACLSSMGVTLVQWNALREIDRNPDSSMHRLAELTFNSDQAFGKLMNRLLILGFVRRGKGTGRALVHTLTQEGLQVLRQGEPLMASAANSLFAPLTPGERRTLGELVGKLLGAVEANGKVKR